MRKRYLFAAAVPAMIIAASAGWKTLDYRSRAHASETKLASVQYSTPTSTFILGDIGATPDDTDSIKVLKLRDYVYRTNVVGKTSTQFRAPTAYANLGSKGFEQFCGGMSHVMAWAASSLGVQSRVIQLATQEYLAGRNKFETHVTVEVFLDGKWQISDPTYNVSLQCSDGSKSNLGIAEAKQCIDAGHRLLPQGGKTQIKGRMFSDDQAIYHRWFAAYAPAGAYENEEQITPYPNPEWPLDVEKLYVSAPAN